MKLFAVVVVNGSTVVLTVMLMTEGSFTMGLCTIWTDVDDTVLEAVVLVTTVQSGRRR